MLGRPTSASTNLQRKPPATAPKPSSVASPGGQRAPTLPPAMRLAAKEAASKTPLRYAQINGSGSRRKLRAGSAGSIRRSPSPFGTPPRAFGGLPLNQSAGSSFTSSFSSPNRRGGPDGPTLEAPGATVLGSGPTLLRRMDLGESHTRVSSPMDLGESKSKGAASGRSDFSGLYNTSPWEQRRREGEGARKMRAKFDEFQRWYQQNGASLIQQWQALDEAEVAVAEGGKSWASYDELCDHYGPALTTNSFIR